MVVSDLALPLVAVFALAATGFWLVRRQLTRRDEELRLIHRRATEAVRLAFETPDSFVEHLKSLRLGLAMINVPNLAMHWGDAQQLLNVFRMKHFQEVDTDQKLLAGPGRPVAHLFGPDLDLSFPHNDWTSKFVAECANGPGQDAVSVACALAFTDKCLEHFGVDEKRAGYDESESS